MILKEQAIFDNELMRVLKIKKLATYIGKTDKGDLFLQLNKGQSENDYQFVLDAVPVSKDTNKQLLNILK